MQADIENPISRPTHPGGVPRGEVVRRVTVSLSCAAFGGGFALVSTIGLAMASDNCYGDTARLICQPAWQMAVVSLAMLAAATIGIGGIVQAATAGMRTAYWWGWMAGIAGVYLVLMVAAFAIAS